MEKRQRRDGEIVRRAFKKKIRPIIGEKSVSIRGMDELNYLHKSKVHKVS